MHDFLLDYLRFVEEGHGKRPIHPANPIHIHAQFLQLGWVVLRLLHLVVLPDTSRHVPVRLWRVPRVVRKIRVRVWNVMMLGLGRSV